MRPVRSRVALRVWDGATVWASLRKGSEPLDAAAIGKIGPLLEQARADGVLCDAWYDHGDSPEWSWRAERVVLALRDRDALGGVLERLGAAGFADVRVSLEGEVRPCAIASSASARARFTRQEPGRFGDVELHLAPLAAGRELVIAAAPELDAELVAFFDGVVDGVSWAASRGPEPGRPVIAGTVTWAGGRFHPVDSARAAYRVAAARAFLEAIARPGVVD